MRPGEWAFEGREILVRARDGAARLWIDEEGELHDEIGVVRRYRFDLYAAWALEPEELAVLVAEWMARAIDGAGAVALGDVRPDLRACLYELTPSLYAG